MAIILNGEEMREESAQFKMFQSFCNLSFGCHLVTLKQYCFRLEMPDPGLRWLFFGRNAELRSKDPLERRSFGPRRKIVIWKITIHLRGKHPVSTVLSPLDVAQYFYAERRLSSEEREKVMQEFSTKVYEVADGNLLRILGDYLHGLTLYRGYIGPGPRLLWKAPLLGVKEILGLEEKPKDFKKLDSMMHLRFKRIRELRLFKQEELSGD